MQLFLSWLCNYFFFITQLFFFWLHYHSLPFSLDYVAIPLLVIGLFFSELHSYFAFSYVIIFLLVTDHYPLVIQLFSLCYAVILLLITPSFFLGYVVIFSLGYGSLSFGYAIFSWSRNYFFLC